MSVPQRVLVAPSLLSADFSRLAEELHQVELAGADLVHLDIMDGCFVPNITFGPMIVAAIRRLTDLPLDCHLMVRDPERYIQQFVEAGAKYVTVHAESTPHLHRAVQQISQAGAVPGVALNPATPPEAVQDVLSDVGLLLVMTVNPGFGGQAFINGMEHKVARAANLCGLVNSRAVIEVDGGITDKTAPLVVGAGARMLVAGSFVFGASNVSGAIESLKSTR